MRLSATFVEKNPWIGSTSWEPGARIVAPDDLHAVGWLEKNHDLTLFPEPFIGNLDSCAVVLLASNPGLKDGDRQVHHHHEGFRAASIRNLEDSHPDRGFFLLEDEFRGVPGNIWWRNLLHRLQADLSNRCGISGWNEMSRMMATAELYPYHSTMTSGSRKLRQLASSQYTYKRVREAATRGAVLVDIWEARWKHDAWLKELGGVRILGGPRPSKNARQHASVDRAHLGDEGYEIMLGALVAACSAASCRR